MVPVHAMSQFSSSNLSPANPYNELLELTEPGRQERRAAYETLLGFKWGFL